ncbi:MAG TPA: hypothetical protein VH479_09805 [Acidimicrobiales bacterium]
MSTDRELARLALSLVEGTVRGEPAAAELLADGFADVGEAARAHAYLAGFLLTALADARGEAPEESCRFLRRLLA